MKKSLLSILLTLFFIPTLYLPNIYAQSANQLSLPDNAKLRLGKGRISQLKYSPDGTRLAVVSSIGIWLYDTQTYNEVALLKGDSQLVYSAAFTSDGQTLASGNADGSIQLWNATTAEYQRTLSGHTNTVLSIAFSSNGQTTRKWK